MLPVADMLLPHHHRRIFRRLIVGALIGTGAAAAVEMGGSIYRIALRVEWVFPIGWAICLTSLVGMLIGWMTRPTLFQTALHLDGLNQTGELFSSAMIHAGDRQFGDAVEAHAAAMIGWIKPEPFLLIKKLGEPVVLLLAMSMALSIWPIAPKSSAKAVIDAKDASHEEIRTSMTLIRPGEVGLAPDPASDSPGNPLFASQPMAGKGYSDSDPAKTEHVPGGGVLRVDSGDGNSGGFPSLSGAVRPAGWRGGVKSGEGDLNDKTRIPAEYDDVLERYFSRTGM
jgi:hypothetical protein